MVKMVGDDWLIGVSSDEGSWERLCHTTKRQHGRYRERARRGLTRLHDLLEDSDGSMSI